jgi:hypothetical protein
VTYLYRIISAIFLPHRLQEKIRCKHPEEEVKSSNISAGKIQDRMYWCTRCDAQWYQKNNKSF